VPNNQEYPQAIYPDTGDVTSAVGDSNLVVAGIQRVPVVPTAPTDQQSIVFQASVGTGEYVPTFSPFNRTVQCNGVGVSDDYDFYCNGHDVSTNQVNSATSPASQLVYVNGSPVG
jgi:hypothetical protein